ncbi:hypothetical protein EJB05_23695, partial [Eragrostis curvula]
MAFAARRSLATRLSHHLTRRVHPGVPHALTSRSDDEPACPSPPPPPPLQAPLLHSSRAAQTVSLLPFSLHFTGTTRRSFSSSAPAPVPDSTPPAEVDTTSLLADAADAAASVRRRSRGRWASIALTTLLIRSATIPLLVNQLKATTKLNAIKPEMEAIKDMTDTMDLKSAKDGQKKMQELFKKYIKNMVEKCPSLKEGGTLWFTDLTTPDSLYIFPVLTGLTFLATVELNLQEGMEGNPMAGKMKMFSRGMAFMSVPFTMSFSKGIFCYWITSNFFSLAYGIVIRRPVVRKLFNLPELVDQSSGATKPTLNLFGGSSKAIPAAQAPAALMAGQPDAAALGYRVKNLEKKVKSRGKSRKRR